jgi:hypothetical protein
MRIEKITQERLFEALTDLVKMVSGLQNNIKDLINVGYLMKKRIEKLEAKQEIRERTGKQ